jgi:hypothetical protein
VPGIYRVFSLSLSLCVYDVHVSSCTVQIM